MANKKISELVSAEATLSGVVPVSDAGGTTTNKVTIQSILSAETRWNLFLPPVPTGLTANGGNTQVSLSWTAPVASYIPPITDYVVQYSSNGGSTWTTFSDGTSTATSVTVTGLTNGTTYVFRVAAVNALGTGAYATSSSVTPSNFFAIPTMTSNTSPSGVVSVVSLGNTASFGFEPYYAFDGNNSTYVQLDSGNHGIYLQYAFPEGVTSEIGGYSLRNAATYGMPNSWNFLGSNDGSTWTTIHEKRSQAGLWGNQPWDEADNVRTINFALDSPVQYRMFRWTFIAFYNNTIKLSVAQLLP